MAICHMHVLFPTKRVLICIGNTLLNQLEQYIHKQINVGIGRDKRNANYNKSNIEIGIYVKEKKEEKTNPFHPKTSHRITLHIIPLYVRRTRCASRQYDKSIRHRVALYTTLVRTKQLPRAWEHVSMCVLVRYI